MKKLLKYLKGYEKETVFGPLFKLLEASFELLTPLVMAHIIDVGIKHADVPYVLRMCVVMIGLGLVGFICSVTAQYFAAKAAVGFATSLRHDLFRHILGLSYQEIDKLGTSTMTTRMTSDLNQVQNAVNMSLRLFLRSPFIVFGAMIMAFTIDVKCAVLFAVVIPLLAVVVFSIILSSMPLYRNVQKKLDEVLLLTKENLEGARVVRAFNRQKKEKHRFTDTSRELMNRQLFVGRISALMNPLTYILINFALLALIWQGGIQVDTGRITQGEVVALVNYMSQILVELIKLANLIVSLSKAIACGNRISDLLEVESSMEEGEKKAPAKSDYAVEFQDVTFRYDKASESSLSHLSVQAKMGETIGIIGGTGSGKSTLVQLIPRFYDASEGQVKVLGQKVQDYSYEELRSLIGVVPQRAVLFAGTIRDNMRWGKEDATDQEIWDALEAAQAKEFVMAKKDGLDTWLEQGGRNLSGGQRQRLTIARALVRKPKILILDDSASALDYATEASLREALKHLGYRLSLWIVSQRASSILHADQIIVLEDGEVAGMGTHRELLDHCEVYREIYESQFPKEGETA
ncbi:MAG: ABC transporter ATP-binding protein [Clostridiales bacterium]|nr:ABC transporter ATP-binding protein [Clostridiales bacterium]